MMDATWAKWAPVTFQLPMLTLHTVPLFLRFSHQDSVVGEGRDMDAGEVKALAQGVAAIDMGL